MRSVSQKFVVMDSVSQIFSVMDNVSQTFGVMDSVSQTFGVMDSVSQTFSAMDSVSQSSVIPLCGRAAVQSPKPPKPNSLYRNLLYTNLSRQIIRYPVNPPNSPSLRPIPCRPPATVGQWPLAVPRGLS
jgi:hypothetical protein